MLVVDLKRDFMKVSAKSVRISILRFSMLMLAVIAAIVSFQPFSIAKGGSTEGSARCASANGSVHKSGGSKGSLSFLTGRCDNVLQSNDFPALEEIDRAISGADSVVVNGVRMLIKTRYAYSESKNIAFDYLASLITNHTRCDLKEQDFVLQVRKPDLRTSVLSASADTLWLGSIEGKVYRCIDPQEQMMHFEEIADIEEKIFDFVIDEMGRLWAACGLKGGGLGALFMSADGGQSWVERGEGGRVYTLRCIAFGNEIFGMAAGSYGTVVRTADGGAYWASIDPGIFSYHTITGIDAASPMHYRLVSYFGEVYETSDIGTNWSMKSLPVFPTYAIDFCDSDHGVVVGEDVVYYTSNGGTDWHEVDVAADLRNVCMVDSELVVAAGVDGALWRSDDGGASWTELSSICSNNSDANDITPLDDDTFIFAGENVVRRVDIGQDGKCDTIALADTTVGRNIVFDHRGSSEPDSVIVVCAHYDAISRSDPMQCAPGADDNGSGVITVLHTAHAIDSVSTRKTIEFILFDGEEVGLVGSRYFVSHLDTNRVYECAINVDMIGYNADGKNSLTIVGREGSIDDSMLVDGFIAAADSISSGIVCDPLPGASYPSDHYSFWDVDVPSILLIEGRRGDWTPYYHSCSDTYDHVDFDFVSSVGAATTRFVLDLAGEAVANEAAATVMPVLYPNYPNPFSIGTIITYSLPGPSIVRLAVYDVLGRRVAVVDEGYRDASDTHIIRWDPRDKSRKRLSEGVYFLRLETRFGETTRKIVLVH